MSDALFEAALVAARDLHATHPDLNGFAAWPDDISFTPREAHLVPAVALLSDDALEPLPHTAPMQRAVQALAPQLEWRHTYTVEEVGQDFLNRYGWFELIGPTGHFQSSQLRLCISYWGAGLYYPWHAHGPEEMYFVLSGGAEFETEDGGKRWLGPGDTQMHLRHQPHAMTTHDSPILTYVLWRGEGLAEPPRMRAA